MGDSLSESKPSGRAKTFHNKTGHSIILTPPSPANSSPTLTQSTSNSTPSPPLPTTPPRSSRSRSRYPDLGRVPLHRRGTSKTYERLEDLLREAGYKETRIFTPEGEHVQTKPAAPDTPSSDQQGGVKNGVGALVDFLSGLMPNTIASRSATSLEVSSEDRNAYSPPVSPLSQRQVRKEKQKQEVSTSSQPSLMTSSIESLESRPSSARLGTTSGSNTPVPMSSRSRGSYQNLQRPKHHMVHRASDQSCSSSRHSPFHNSQTSLHQYSNTHLLPNYPSSQNVSQRPPSRASAYLRHIASVPNIAKQPSLTSTFNAESRGSYNGNAGHDGRRKGNSPIEGPPLPGTWLESIARAVLFGGVGAYIGGPNIRDSATPIQNSSANTKTLRLARSSVSSREHDAKRPGRLRQPSRSAFLDQRNTKRSIDEYPIARPELFSQIQRGRSTTSVSEVSQTCVVCRSAPASRATSAVRGSSNDKREKGNRVRNGKEDEPKRGRGRQRGAERDRLPSLANTRTEGDEWTSGTVTKDGSKHSASGRSKWGVDGDSGNENEEGRMSSSEEEDSELDLARILVNPKRQNSIKSLRKHLVAPKDETTISSKLIKVATGVRTGRANNVRQHIIEDPNMDGSEGENWGSDWIRRNPRRHSGDDDENVASGLLVEWRERPRRGVSGSGRSGTSRNNPRIPGPWVSTSDRGF